MENKKYHNVGTVPKIIVGRDNIDASKTHSRRLTVLARYRYYWADDTRGD
jgi:hypothetical protein